jgi:hypothetical protein
VNPATTAGHEPTSALPNRDYPNSDLPVGEDPLTPEDRRGLTPLFWSQHWRTAFFSEPVFSWLLPGPRQWPTVVERYLWWSLTTFALRYQMEVDSPRTRPLPFTSPVSLNLNSTLRN